MIGTVVSSERGLTQQLFAKKYGRLRQIVVRTDANDDFGQANITQSKCELQVAIKVRTY